MDSRELLRILRQDGWMEIAQEGSHRQFKHPTKPGKVTLQHPRKDIPPKTLRSIYRQAQLPWPPR
jgi:predicted RNA binding protein YcfA (HicA-like mRNA interferase family)